MANTNSKLTRARRDKKDEFYTRIQDIENELRWYKDHFRDKIVLCNCDDPYESNFFAYFALNFQTLGLKKLIATCYDGSPIAGEQLNLFETRQTRKAYKVEVTEAYDANGDTGYDLRDAKLLIENGVNKLEILKGNGDFRSPECIELLKEADIIATNPPFSLFREFVALLMKYQKKFVIIGNVSAITYKEIFPLFMQNQIWLGKSIHSGDREMRIPDHYEARSKSLRIDEEGHKWIRVPSLRWFTNLDYSKWRDKIELWAKYDPEKNPRYDNYDAIEIGKTADIPMDYDGVMGVPITFMDHYNPDQFEILGSSTELAGEIEIDGKLKKNPGRFYVKGKRLFERILIRRKR